MKLSHKTLVAGAVIAFAVMGTAFAEGEFTFENELSTDTYRIGDWNDDVSRFPGIEERMQGKYTGEKVDINANLLTKITGYSENVAGEKKTVLEFGGFWIKDSYIKFRPTDVMQISLAGFLGAEKAKGSYLPVADTNTYIGRYTGNFGLLFKPLEGLSIGTGIDFGNLIDNRYDNSNQINLNFGAEYEIEKIGSFAVTFNDVVNDFSIGAYAKISAISDLDIYAGFAFHKNFGQLMESPVNSYNRNIRGKTILNAGFEYKGIDKLTLAADLATNLFNNADHITYYDDSISDWIYSATDDLYAGLKITYDLNDAFTLGCYSYMVFDLVDSENNELYDFCASPLITIYPEMSYKIGNHTFKAGLQMDFAHEYVLVKNADRDSIFTVSIPLSWKYSF